MSHRRSHLILVASLALSLSIVLWIRSGETDVVRLSGVAEVVTTTGVRIAGATESRPVTVRVGDHETFVTANLEAEVSFVLASGTEVTFARDEVVVHRGRLSVTSRNARQRLRILGAPLVIEGGSAVVVFEPALGSEGRRVFVLDGLALVATRCFEAGTALLDSGRGFEPVAFEAPPFGDVRRASLFAANEEALLQEADALFEALGSVHEGLDVEALIARIKRYERSHFEWLAHRIGEWRGRGRLRLLRLLIERADADLLGALLSGVEVGEALALRPSLESRRFRDAALIPALDRVLSFRGQEDAAPSASMNPIWRLNVPLARAFGGDLARLSAIGLAAPLELCRELWFADAEARRFGVTVLSANDDPLVRLWAFALTGETSERTSVARYLADPDRGRAELATILSDPGDSENSAFLEAAASLGDGPFSLERAAFSQLPREAKSAAEMASRLARCLAARRGDPPESDPAVMALEFRRGRVRALVEALLVRDGEQWRRFLPLLSVAPTRRVLDRIVLDGAKESVLALQDVLSVNQEMAALRRLWSRARGSWRAPGEAFVPLPECLR